jgi:hypothetical protein
LGAGMKFDRVNRNAVAPVLKARVFHLRLYATGHNPFRVGEIVASGVPR